MPWSPLVPTGEWTGEHLKRWRFQGYDSNGLQIEYAFYVNPNEATVPTQGVALNSMVTTAGRVLVTEASGEAPQWEFSGVFVDVGAGTADEQFDQMITWMVQRRPIFVVDHYDRRFRGVIREFSPTMQLTRPQSPYRHMWSMQMTILTLSDGRTFQYMRPF